MNITIYSTSSCSECLVLKNWLDKQSIAYTSKITDESTENMMEFMTLNDGMISVPLTIIDKDDGTRAKLTGFNAAKLQSAIGTA